MDTTTPTTAPPPTSPPPRHGRPGRLGAVAALVLLLAACGSGDAEEAGVVSLDGDTSATAADSAAGSGGDPQGSDAQDTEAELLAYVECLRGEGLDVPDPTVDAEGNLSLGGPGGAGGAGAGEAGPVDADAFEAAVEVCGDVPEGAVAGLADVDATELEDAALAFAECMREEGVDVPDPDLSGGPGQGGGGGPFGDLDMDDPAVQAAMDVCQQVFTDSGVDLP